MKINQLFSYIGVALISFLAAYLIWGVFGKKKTPEVITNTVYLPSVQYHDTCLAAKIDSFDIYRTIRKGIIRKHLNMKPESVLKDTAQAETNINTYTYKKNDGLLSFENRVKVDGVVLSADMEYTLDTLELIRLFRIVDSFPVYIQPTIIQTPPTEVVKPFIPRSIGFSSGGSFNFDPLGQPVLSGGLYYQDKKLKRYAIRIGTDKSIEGNFDLPIWKSKK